MEQSTGGLSDYVDPSSATLASDVVPEPSPEDAAALSDAAVAAVGEGTSLKPRWLKIHVEIPLEYD